MEKVLDGYLKELKLPSIREWYRDLAKEAKSENMGYEEYLLVLVEKEREERGTRRVEKMLKSSKLPLEKTFESFERGRLPLKVNAQLDVLADGSFCDRKENVLAFGNPGSGKTHLLCAIGQELIYKGRKVLFKSCNFLVQELLRAKKELKLAKALKKLSKYDALIIDDIGYVQQNREEMEVLFALIADRYERSSIMLTSNLPFSGWESIFKSPMTTAAAIDRLVHHSIILELNIPSYRLEHAKKG